MHQDDSPLATLHIEHVLPKKHGGTNEIGNLALACIDCNLHKGPNLTGIDPKTGEITQLFHPRQQQTDHCRFLRARELRCESQHHPVANGKVWDSAEQHESYEARRASRSSEFMFKTRTVVGLHVSCLQGRYQPIRVFAPLYNGHARWKSPTDTAALVPQVPAGLEAFRPRVNYLLLDEGTFQPRELEAMPNPVARLFRLEHAGPEDLLAEVQRLRESLQGSEHRELRRAFVICILAILRRRLQGIRLPETRELEEIETMLAEKAPTWTEMWEQQGLEKGLAQGRQQGRREGRREGESTMLLRLLESRFGRLDEKTLARVASGDADRLLEWGERILTAERLEDVFGN